MLPGMKDSSLPILVTGGAGYIGSHAHHALIEQGYSVVVYDNFSTGSREAIHPKATVVEADILDTERLTRLLRQQPIMGTIHFAASIRVEDSLKDPLSYYQNNTGGVISLLSALRAAQSTSPIIFSSTAAVYGESESGTVSEDTQPSPINPYGQSKWFSEKILTEHCKTNEIPLGILRYFNVAGAHSAGNLGSRAHNASHLIKVACEVALGKREKICIFGNNYPTKDGTGVRDYIHVDDLVQAHIQALQHLWQTQCSFFLNCGYGKGVSVLEVIQTFEKILGAKLPIEIQDRRPGDPAELVADPTRIKSILKWQPKMNDLEKICQTALDWEKCLSK